MIISRRRFNEKVHEALERADRERWVHEKIDRVERDCDGRITNLQKQVWDLENKVALLLDEKKGGAK